MASTATWLIIVGFVLLMSGIVLRTVIMMRSSDASDPNARALHGRELILQYRKFHPKSIALLLARWLLISGIILLLAGLSMEFAH